MYWHCRMCDSMQLPSRKSAMCQWKRMAALTVLPSKSDVDMPATSSGISTASSAAVWPLDRFRVPIWGLCPTRRFRLTSSPV